MARKSNKTAHVLNLLAGPKNEPEETAPAEEKTQTPASEKSAPENSVQTPEEKPVEKPAEKPIEKPVGQATENTAPAQNISVIDNTEKDPLAELIQSKLADELEKELAEAEAPVSEPVMEKTSAEEETTAEATSPEEPMPEETAVKETISEETPAEAPVVTEAPAEEPVTEELAAETAAEETAAEEPDFISLNIMERIVKDKIIYYMRQFGVCTCDRCVADTVALTLNGLMPKYIVTFPEAVDALLNIYTNRYISDVTVEATKACIVIKENPRH